MHNASSLLSTSVIWQRMNYWLAYVDGVTEPNVMHQECEHIDYDIYINDTVGNVEWMLACVYLTKTKPFLFVLCWALCCITRGCSTYPLIDHLHAMLYPECITSCNCLFNSASTKVTSDH